MTEADDGPPLAMEREQIICSLHWLLGQLHASLASNRAPEPEVAEIAERIAAWWDRRQTAQPLPVLRLNEADKD